MGVKFIFWGFSSQKFKVTSFTPQKGTSLHRMTHFEPSLVQIGRVVALCKVTQMFPPHEKLHPMKFMLAEGADINAPHCCVSICRPNCTLVLRCSRNVQV